VTPETDVNDVRRLMLERHTRYLPVLEGKTLMGVISFYDVARAVLKSKVSRTGWLRPTFATGLRPESATLTRFRARCVVGAGIGRLACASALAAARRNVTVFEKAASRAVASRAGDRCGVFDAGAQSSHSKPRFEAAVQRWLDVGQVQR